MWFLNSAGNTCVSGHNKVGRFMRKVEIFKEKKKNEKNSKERLKVIAKELQEEQLKIVQLGVTSEAKEIRRILWSEKKMTILNELKIILEDCDDDSKGLIKLCHLVECASSL